MKTYLATVIALAVLAGCGNKSEPKTAPVAPPVAATDAQPVIVPAPPAPAKAVDDGVQRPTPGQAGDTSSPEFKAGGKADSKK
jgi:hypothetical protein